MRSLISCFLIAGCGSLLRAQVNIDSVYAARYSKTLSDSVFIIGDLVRVPEIRFDMDGHGFSAGSDSSFKALAAFYTRNPFVITEIQVHTDTRGEAESNLELSLNCARAILSYLLRYYSSDFVFAERIIPVGKGETIPIISEDFINLQQSDRETFELLHQINRRTEIKITGFLGKNFYLNQRSASSEFDIQNTRNSAYYEDLILIADRALLEGNYQKALEFYSFAADLSPAHETYAAEQREKVRVLLDD